MRLTTEHHDTLAAIAFCDTSSPCVGVEHPSFPALFYMDIRADEPSGHTSFFNGYVTREVLALVKTAPDLLALARQYASECAECAGRGFVYAGDGITGRGPDDVEPTRIACAECDDICRIIAHAEGKS